MSAVEPRAHPESAAQLTPRAIVLAVVLAVVLAAANTYLGLFAGLTIASAIPAAVVSMAVLRVLGGGHILEHNIVQTGASAGSSIAAGVIFTLPALVILGYWEDFRYGWVLAIAGLGGLLGVLFSVPLRRSFIVDQQLAFPEGKAAAEVLRTGEDRSGIALLAGASALGGLVKFAAASGLRLIPDTAALAAFAGRGVAYFGTNLSPALLGVGYIVGFNVGTVVLLGGVLSWNVAIPLYSAFLLEGNATLAARLAGADAETVANVLWSTQIRYLGVGAMLVGGLWTLVSLRHSLVAGVRSGLEAARNRSGAGTLHHSERDLPMPAVLLGLVLFTAPLAVLYYLIVDHLGIAIAMTLVMVVAGFLFSSVSGYMAGLVGSSNNPVSGITIATILVAALLLLAMLGSDSSLGPVAAIMIGAVVCCAAAVAGDNLQDLKCGHLVGATPWRQQVMLGIGAVSCALVMAPVLQLLNAAYGIGVATPEHPNPLLAPQATLMASVASGLFGGSLPWPLIAAGAAVGAIIIAVDAGLAARGARFRVPVLAAAVGIYLPLELSVPIFLGGCLAAGVDRVRRRYDESPSTEATQRRGLLFAAGLIAGESLIGLVIAVPIVVSGRPDVLALPAGWQLGEGVGLASLALVAVLFYRGAVRR